MIRSFHVFLALLLAVFSVGAAKAGKIVVSGCGVGSYDPTLKLMPLKPGLLTLVNVYCLTLPSSSSPPRPSPDKNNTFVFDSIRGLYLAQAGATSTVHHFDGRVTAVQNGSFAWSGDSRSVFGVRQETAKPSGHALGPIKPFLFRIDGTQEKLTELTNPAGPLDEIYWVGHAGIAIAAFGTKGRYYRPEHPDPHPTIAFVDARAGRILQSMAIARVPGLDAKSIILGIASGLDSRGNPYALIALAPYNWVLWVQGQTPRLVPIHVKPSVMPAFALSPGGKSVLVMENLSATGVICERDPKCPAPTPQNGPIAGLHELPSGKLLWTLDGTAKTFSRSNVPAVSPDGRFALVSTPTGTIALLSMRNGAVLHEIPKPWTDECAMGFSSDGRKVWISGGSTLVFYKLEP